MNGLWIGVGSITLHIRHSRSLKDKRNVMQSIIQKLRNQGFSVSESGFPDNPKQGSIGYCFAGRAAPEVRQAMDQIHRVLIGDFEVVGHQQDVFDYSSDADVQVLESEGIFEE